MPETIRSKIRGVSKGNRQEYIQSVFPGDQLDLRREPDNLYDENAIKVFAGDYSDDDLGYLSKDLAERLAPILDSYKQLVMAEVIDITGEYKRTQGVNIELTIYTEEETQEITKWTNEKYAALKTEPAIQPEPAIKIRQPRSFTPELSETRTPKPEKTRSSKPAKPKSSKNIYIVLVLWLLLGPLGAHRAYVGRWSWLYALTLGYFVFGWLYDLVEIVFKAFKDKSGKVVWF